MSGWLLTLFNHLVSDFGLGELFVLEVSFISVCHNCHCLFFFFFFCHFLFYCDLFVTTTSEQRRPTRAKVAKGFRYNDEMTELLE